MSDADDLPESVRRMRRREQTVARARGLLVMMDKAQAALVAGEVASVGDEADRALILRKLCDLDGGGAVVLCPAGMREFLAAVAELLTDAATGPALVRPARASNECPARLRRLEIET